MSSQFRTERVALGDRSYDVIVGGGAIGELPKMIPAESTRVAIVSQKDIPLVDDVVALLAQRLHVEMQVFTVPRGETDKSLDTIRTLCSSFAEFGLTRQDVIVAVGGGMVTDLAGFAAAVWHRGTRVIHVPTSLLGMVDAAIGGKTAVNLPQGKNLVGAFWQPMGVICDLDSLATLPEREMKCGLGEVAKYHFMSGLDLVDMDMHERIAACIRIKADIVAADEREGGRRALLNYGHTLGHAIETVAEHELAHGEAVAIGLVFAARLARDLGRIDQDRVDYHDTIVGDVYGLLTRPPVPLGAADLLHVMGRDKKALKGLTFVLDSSRGLEVVAGVDETVVRQTLEEFLGTTR